MVYIGFMHLTIDTSLLAGMGILGGIGNLLLDAGFMTLADRILTIAVLLSVVLFVRLIGSLITWAVSGK